VGEEVATSALPLNSALLLLSAGSEFSALKATIVNENERHAQLANQSIHSGTDYGTVEPRPMLLFCEQNSRHLIHDGKR